MRLDVTIEIPDMELVLDEPPIVSAVANALAQDVKSRIRSGVSPTGASFPQPGDGGQPFVRTGKMVDSIKMRMSKSKKTGKSRAVVSPTGSRGKGQPSNLKLAKILERRTGADIVGVGDIDRDKAIEIAQGEVDRQVAAGTATLSDVAGLSSIIPPRGE